MYLSLVRVVFGPRTRNISSQFTHSTFCLETYYLWRKPKCCPGDCDKGNLRFQFCLRKMGSSAPHCGGSGIAFLTLWHQDWNNIVGGAKTNQARWKGHWCDITTISPASQFFLSGIPDFRFSQCTLKRALLRKVQAQHLKKWKKKRKRSVHNDAVSSHGLEKTAVGKNTFYCVPQGISNADCLVTPRAFCVEECGPHIPLGISNEQVIIWQQ